MSENIKVAAISMAREIADSITIDPAVMVGKPVIKGTRMPVELVLAKLAANPDLEEFFLDYPELSVEDVKAVLAYASTLGPQASDSSGRPLARAVRFLLDESAEARIALFLTLQGHDATRIGLD